MKFKGYSKDGSMIVQLSPEEIKEWEELERFSAALTREQSSHHCHPALGYHTTPHTCTHGGQP